MNRVGIHPVPPTAAAPTVSRKEVFIVGAPRSGTSIVGLALTRALKATWYTESHMMPFFASHAHSMRQRFEDVTARRFPDMLAAKTTLASLDKHFLNAVREFYREAYDDSHIIDKTPGLNGVRAIRFARRVFPSAWIVLCHRRALENVESRLRKWPEVPFETHCREWSAIMSEWRTLRDDLDQETYREVDQHVLATSPEPVAQTLADMLGLAPDQTDLVAETFKTKEISMVRGSTKGRTLDFDHVEWEERQKTLFLDICEEEMKRWGYTLDETYRDADPDDRSLFSKPPPE